MKVPLEVSFHGIDHSDAVESRIRERADKLETYFDRITSCRVAVELPAKHQNKGNLFHVRVDLTLPGHEILVNRDPSTNQAHTDVYIALRDAFDAAERQLKDYVSRKRDEERRGAAKQ